MMISNWNKTFGLHYLYKNNSALYGLRGVNQIVSLTAYLDLSWPNKFTFVMTIFYRLNQAAYLNSHKNLSAKKLRQIIWAPTKTRSFTADEIQW